MARPITVRLDRELESELRAWASENGLTKSQAMRELLRQALGHADPIDRAYKEAFATFYHDFQRAAERDG